MAGANAIDPVVEAIQTHMANWTPEGAEDILGFTQALPRVWEALSGTMHTLADRATSDMPLEPAVGEHFREMGSATAGLTAHAEAAEQILRANHETEIKRIEEPRPDEQVWDVRN